MSEKVTDTRSEPVKDRKRGEGPSTGAVLSSSKGSGPTDEQGRGEGPSTGSGSINERGRRKVREGYVVGDKMDKTVVVAVEDRVKHRLYGKVLRQTSRLKAHDEDNSAAVGDRVRVMETRPLSATKRWRLVEIIEKAK
jgi:small subunit ribosomal protein S17